MSVGVACRSAATCVDRSARWARCCWHAFMVDWCRRLLVFVGSRVGGGKTCIDLLNVRTQGNPSWEHGVGPFGFVWPLPGDGGGLLGLCGVWSVGSAIGSMLEWLVGGGQDSRGCVRESRKLCSCCGWVDGVGWGVQYNIGLVS